MDEVRRFLRFTLPGLACVITLLIAFSFSDPSAIGQLLKSAWADKTLGVVIGVFLASGGLGYILANIYFSIYWSWPFSRVIAINHRSLLTSLNDNLEIVDISGKKLNLQRISKRDAWTIVTQYWFSQIEGSNNIKGINSTTDRLVDFTHSLGATFIGILLSFAAWTYVHFFTLNPTEFNILSKDSFVVTMWIIYLLLICLAYLRTLKALESIVNSTVAEKIRKDSKQEKIKIYYIR